jgi:hypothetical protein
MGSVNYRNAREPLTQSAHTQKKTAGKMHLARVWLASEVFVIFSQVYMKAQKRVLMRPQSLLVFQISGFAGQNWLTTMAKILLEFDATEKEVT